MHRRGRPAAVLVPPSADELESIGTRRVGLAALAGALADWEELEDVVEEIYAARRTSRDRPPPDLG